MASDTNFDVIVVGAGIAGLVAANRAAQLGKRVAVLEKSTEERYLCNSRYTYGTFHIHFTGVDAAEDELFDKIETATEGFAPGKFLEQRFRRAGQPRRLQHQRSVAGMAPRLRPDMAGLCRRRRA